METMRDSEELEFRRRTEEIVELMASIRSKYLATTDTEPETVQPVVPTVTRRVVERDLSRDSVLFRDMDAQNLFDVLNKKLSRHNIAVGMGKRLLNVFRSHNSFTYGDFLDYNEQLRMKILQAADLMFRANAITSQVP